jgi:hypothetical protein
MKLDVDVAVCAFRFAAAADNTITQFASGSNLCARPHDCVFQNCTCFDTALPSDDRTTPHLRGWIDNRSWVDRQSPIFLADGIFRKGGRQLAVHLEISLAIADVPPLPVIDDNAADLFPAPDEIDKVRNNGALHAAFEKIDKFSIDNVNAGENELILRAGTQLVANIDDAPAANIECDVFRLRVRAQCQRHEIAVVKVVVDQGSKRQIG